MASYQFINTQIKDGVWQGDLTGAGQEMPDLQVTHLGQVIDGLTFAHDAAHDMWRVRLPLPSSLIFDGVQTFLLHDNTGTTLCSFSLIVGEPLADDLRAEIALLRGELEVLKSALRRHCAES